MISKRLTKKQLIGRKAKALNNLHAADGSIIWKGWTVRIVGKSGRGLDVVGMSRNTYIESVPYNALELLANPGENNER